MPATALAFALAAAVFHALWNLLLARAPDVEAATVVALLTAVLVFALTVALTPLDEAPPDAAPPQAASRPVAATAPVVARTLVRKRRREATGPTEEIDIERDPFSKCTTAEYPAGSQPTVRHLRQVNLNRLPVIWQQA